MRKVVQTDRAPGAVGPYSQAVSAAGCVWVSGQIGLDPGTGQLVGGTIEAETRQALDNLFAILEAAGSGPERVVRTTVYLTDLDDFARVNETYRERFPGSPPARVCVEVARLPKGARVEIDAVALGA